MTPTEAALRAALEKAQWALGTVCCHDTETQEARTEGLAACAKALAAPPHGKDAGEEPFAEIASRWGSRFDGVRCIRHRQATCPSCLAYALGDALGVAEAATSRASTAEARLTEAEGLLRKLAADYRLSNPAWGETDRFLGLDKEDK